jgi:hypothetical protein
MNSYIEADHEIKELFDEITEKHGLEELRVPLPIARAAVREMARKGILKHSVAVDCDGIPHGSGYFLTTKWDC